MNGHISKSHCAILFVCSLGALTLIAVTLFWVQIVHHSFYAHCGERQYFFTMIEYPPRAPILDCTGTRYLALNAESIAAFVIPQEIKDRPGLEQFLQQYFPDAYTRLIHTDGKKFMYVARRLTQAEQELITEAHITDIHFLKEPSRFYPVPAAGCIIGLTDIENNGLFGIEKTYDTLLKGKPHILHVEKDARSGYYIRRETLDPGYVGTPIQLTIDGTLQFLVYEAVQHTVQHFNAQCGSAVIIDPITGAIHAMVNVPCFDPQCTEMLNIAHTKVNCITDLYEFGSVFKVFSALAALAEDVVTPHELIDCQNKKTAYLQGRRINTVIAHDKIPFVDTIAFSNNIGIATVAQRIGHKLYNHYCMLGFGTKTGIELSGEASGFVNNPKNWSKQSLISLSYGYEITASVLQLAKAFAIIARNGVSVDPYIIEKPTQRIKTTVKVIYPAELIGTIKDILRRTTQYGTARKAQVHGCTVMSKTGTANMLINGVYVPTKNRYTCAGIVEKGNYQRIIVTFIQEAERGDLFAATVTAPLFEEIAERMLMHEQMV